MWDFGYRKGFLAPENYPLPPCPQATSYNCIRELWFHTLSIYPQKNPNMDKGTPISHERKDFHQNAAFSSKRAHGKIIGGGFADQGEFPFMLALLSDNSQICGASAMSEVWALTAAHCVFNPPRVYYAPGTPPHWIFRRYRNQWWRPGIPHIHKLWLIYVLSEVKEGYGNQVNPCRDQGLNPGPPAQKSDTLPLDHEVTKYFGDELTAPTSLSLRSGSVKHAEDGYIHDVTKIIPHHKYHFMQYDEDIAVLKVKQPFSINKLIGYVSLPLQGEPVEVGTKTVVIGWGLTEEGSGSDLLKETTVDVVDEQICEEFPQFRGILYISKNMICAVTEGTDSAPGDSGGPLVVLKGEKAIQVGLVSWGLGTGQANDPGIYTKISQYRFWIYMKTGI
uniref:Peptidase S1 domain-containing protein n=1 Tax=Timema genevievae TaxID=629358 RepID=A0A7R9JWQ1_TIMGE|nr:unnamed protein product [Timema genevievae]